MKLRYLGYVGQNLSTGLTTGRTLRLANLSPERVAGVVEANLAALRTILEWNLEHDIRFFRLASSLIPFASHPDFALDWESRFAAEFADLHAFIARHGMRVTMHPGQYTVLNSPKPSVVTNALAELEYSAAVLEGLDPDSGTMTLHLGGAYGDKGAAKARFIAHAARLSPRARGRLVLENDDTVFAIDDVLEVCEALALPAVFDFHHHRVFHPPTLEPEPSPELLERVVASWSGRVPKFHLSSPRAPGASSHADYIAAEDLAAVAAALAPVAGDAPFDLMLEAKAKDRAVLSAQGDLGPARPQSDA